MGLLDKVKNLFTEEVIIEDKSENIEPRPVKKKRSKTKEKPEPIQKEVIKVEIPSPQKQVDEIDDYDNFDIETKESVETPKKEEYKFPFFDDDDFDTFEVKEQKKEEKKLYKPEVYNPPKEEKKIFKPSPIISPIFGFMDKDYKKENNLDKRDYSSRRATVDEIRDKAFGGLESDIEDTLFGTGRVLFDEDDNAIDLEAMEEDGAIDKIENYDEQIVGEKPRHENIKEEDDLTDLLEAEMAKPEKKKSNKKKPRKISDKELFNLIDSMYEGEIK